ncbi:IS1182 family transposase [Falsirhodobacter sp. 20TX0035]|uniref:IS1182 family transposase n=1 Tax=Falsirhodobacter sp. 20TX0035 TaxID=3022019 RepID=UPI00232FA860|nr:IS1182 family transposase [Falsirhodobacter sp. 20TX0035]MDB6454953.1 IS1182 family transposase [Falsirhodobacter sp. 20TX0035]
MITPSGHFRIYIATQPVDFRKGMDGLAALVRAEFDLDPFYGSHHLVRVVDLFVDEFDLIDLGFGRAAHARTGRPGYHPAVLLKLFIYGYLNRIPSSRRLEREAGRNVELMWLTGRLVPDHKTIADFRRDNGPDIRRTCARFMELCRRIGVLKGACVAIDGSKSRAVNSRDRNFTKGKIASRIAHLEADVERYTAEMVRVDRQEEGGVRAEKVAHLAKRYGRVRQHIQHPQAMDRALADAPEGQISLSDPDVRAMATSARNSGMVGYNVQTAVDAETHLIVVHDVTNQGHDRDLLMPMARAAQEALHREIMHVLADKGYFSGRQILTCHEAGITTTVPKPETSPNRVKGMYVKPDFAYEADADVYRCPAGQALTYRYTTEEDGLELRRYWTGDCGGGLMKTRCTTGKERRITRWAHEHLIGAARARLIGLTEPMTVRRGTVEHPFGTLKGWMGTSHFLTRRLRNVKTEIALNVLAYNIKRMVALIGIRGLRAEVKA